MVPSRTGLSCLEHSAEGAPEFLCMPVVLCILVDVVDRFDASGSMFVGKGTRLQAGNLSWLIVSFASG